MIKKLKPLQIIPLASYLGAVVVSFILTIALSGDWLSYIFMFFCSFSLYLLSLRIRAGLLLFSANILIYLYISFTNALYGEFAINIIIMLIYIASFFKWSASTKNNTIRSIDYKTWLVIAALSIVFVPLYTILLSAINTAQPFLNALSTFFAATAVLMIAKRVYFQHLFWALVNVVQIILWATMLDYLSMTIFNAFFLVANVANLIGWLRQYRAQIALNIQH